MPWIKYTQWTHKLRAGHGCGKCSALGLFSAPLSSRPGQGGGSPHCLGPPGPGAHPGTAGLTHLSLPCLSKNTQAHRHHKRQTLPMTQPTPSQLLLLSLPHKPVSEKSLMSISSSPLALCRFTPRAAFSTTARPRVPLPPLRLCAALPTSHGPPSSGACCVWPLPWPALPPCPSASSVSAPPLLLLPSTPTFPRVCPVRHSSSLCTLPTAVISPRDPRSQDYLPSHRLRS